jgi:hypothetical protein
LDFRVWHSVCRAGMQSQCQTGRAMKEAFKGTIAGLPAMAF